MDSIAFLDAVRKRHGLPSDNKLAKFLKIEQARISSYRRGRRKLDADACVAVANALELPPEHVLASVQAERAKRTEHRRLWEKLAKLARHAGAVVVLAYAATSPAPVQAVAPAGSASPNAAERHIMRRGIMIMRRGVGQAGATACETSVARLRLLGLGGFVRRFSFRRDARRHPNVTVCHDLARESGVLRAERR